MLCLRSENVRSVFYMPVIVYDLQENDPLNVGLKAGFVIGAYGITQAIFQIPFGILSDFFGRKRLSSGLLYFHWKLFCRRIYKYNGVNCRKTCTGYGSNFIGRYCFFS